MNEYPNSDEEYELMYGEELEVMRELEKENYGDPRNPARRSLDFSNTVQSESASLKRRCEDNDLNLSGIEDISDSLPSSQKRNASDLFGDIDDIDFDSDTLHISKKGKFETEDELNNALISRIVNERQKKSELNNALLLKKDYTMNINEKHIENISDIIPRWPFITLTKGNGKKIYVRFHNEEFFENGVDEICKSRVNLSSLSSSGFQEIWKEATRYLEKKTSDSEKERDIVEPFNDIHVEHDTKNDNCSQLWVDRYKPMRYLQLLSDESTNRTLLRWLKMWDKVVFNKEIKIKKIEKSNKFNKRSGKFEFGFRNRNVQTTQEEMFTELDDHNIPKFKVALLCGPPGCGKTTLAHMIAKHAGYNVVEMNASDDRNVEAFKLALENATQMKSVLDNQKRPNCLVMDEIDGAPLPTIEYLIKFISGTVTSKPKKGTKNVAHTLKRPIICICNDVYASSLRPLRQIAFVVHFPPIDKTRLIQRLAEIVAREGLMVEGPILTALGEKTENDIRSCLSILHFLKTKEKRLRFADIKGLNIGQKDFSKGLFQVWQDIFQIHQPKCTFHEFKSIKKGGDFESFDSGHSDGTLKSRSRKIINSVNSMGDNEKLIQGVYENFLTMKSRDSMMLGVNEALDWFIFTDLFSSFINRNQNYNLLPYIPYAFVCWHFQFASLNWSKIKFPNESYEMLQRRNQTLSIVSGVEKGICPRAKPFISKIILMLDFLPLLPHIISPSLRPVNVQLYSEKEKCELYTVVKVMLDYGLQYVQERSQDGTYNYVLDPNILNVAVFNEKTSEIRNLSYATKQLISREVDLEKIKRNELKSKTVNRLTVNNDNDPYVNKKSVQKMYTPNHLQKLQPKTVKDVKVVSKDFFGRNVSSYRAQPNKVGKIDDIIKSPIWFHYKEGFNNAVRKDVKINDLL